MRKPILIVMLTVLFTFAGLTIAQGGAVDELIQTHKKLTQAFHEGNAEALGAGYAEDAQYFTGNGPFRLDGRKAITAWWAGMIRAFPTIRVTHHQVSARVYGGDTGVTTSYLTVLLVNKKGEVTIFQGRISNTWVKKDGRWLRVSSHISKLPSP